MLTFHDEEAVPRNEGDIQVSLDVFEVGEFFGGSGALFLVCMHAS